MTDSNALAWPHTKGKGKKKYDDIGTISDFIEILNATVGKHLKCCICLSILEDPVMLPCNHPLCRGCATQCLRQNQRCPQCMTSIPNLRMLQGRNKWIAEMVGSLKDSLNEVGVSLTQHGPVPPKYRDKPPPESGAAGAAARQRARARARAAAEDASRHPPASCGGAGNSGGGSGGGGGGSRGGGGSSGRGRAAGRRKARGSGRGASRSRERTAPARAAPAPPSSPWSDGDNDPGVTSSSSPPPPPATSPSPPPSPRQPFVVGDLVSVESRTWPGMNKHGGVALVTAVLDPPGSAYDVKYSVSQKADRGVEARYVSAFAFPEETYRRGGGGGGGSRIGDARSRRRSGGGGGGGVSPRRCSRTAAEPAPGTAAARATKAPFAGAPGVAAPASAAAANAAAAPVGLQASQPRTPVGESGGVVGTGEAEDDPSRGNGSGAVVVTGAAAPAEGASPSAAAAAAAAAAPAAAGTSSSLASASERNSGASDGRGGDADALGQHDDGSETSSGDEAPEPAASNFDHDATDTDAGGYPSDGGGEDDEGKWSDDGDNDNDNDTRNKAGDRASVVNTPEVAASPLRGEAGKKRRGPPSGRGGGRGGGSGGLAAPSASSVEERPRAVRVGRGEGERKETSGGAEQEQKELARRGSTPPQPPPLRSLLAGRIPPPSMEEIVGSLLPHSRAPHLARSPLEVGGPENEKKGGGKRRRRDLPLPMAEGGARDTTLAGAAAGLLALAANSGIATHPPASETAGIKGPGIGGVGGDDVGTAPPLSFPRASSQKSGAGLAESGGQDGRLVASGAAQRGGSPPAGAEAAVALGSAGTRPPASLSVRGSCPEQCGDDVPLGTTSISGGQQGEGGTGGCSGGSLLVDDSPEPAPFAEQIEECGADSPADDLENDAEGPAPTPPSPSPPAPSAGPSGVPALGSQRSPLQAMPPPPPPPPTPSLPAPTLARTPKHASPPSPATASPPPPSPPPPAATPFFEAGDLVNVLPRSSPGINREGGVARVTLVRPDGTYDVKYILRQGRERGLAPSFVSRYTMDTEENDGIGSGGGGGGGDGGDKREKGGRGTGAGRGTRSSPQPSYSSSTTEGARGGARPARAVRRTPRANKGWCSPDLAMGQANAACLSYLLGETQNPELDLDPDLGELLDPDEDSNGGGGGGGGGGNGTMSDKATAPPAGKARKQRDPSSSAAAASAVAAAESTAAKKKAEERHADAALSGRDAAEVGGHGGERRRSKGNGKRRRAEAAAAAAAGSATERQTADDGEDVRPSQGQGRSRRRRGTSEGGGDGGGQETIDLSARTPIRPGLGSDASNPQVRDIGSGSGNGSTDSYEVFDLSALTPGSESGDPVAAAAAGVKKAAPAETRARGVAADGGHRGKPVARPRGRGGRAPPSDGAARDGAVVGKKRARPLGTGAAESENVDRKRASGVKKKKDEAVVTKRGGGVAQKGSGNGRSVRAALSSTAPLGEPAVVLTMSGSNTEMSALAGSLAKSLGWRVEPKYTDAVTHVVCGTVSKTNKAKVRSAKFLRAVASGKWVLTESWLQECKRRRARAEEEAFEVSGDKKSPVPSAPTRSRLAHAEVGRPGLFRGITFHFRGEFGTTGSPPLAELESMLLANAGRVVATLEELFADPTDESGTGVTAAAAAAGGGRRRSDSVGGGGGGGGAVAASGGGGSGGWRPRRVVIFHPSSAAPEEEAWSLKDDLAALAGAEPSQQQQASSAAGAEVVKPIWLVDSVGCFRVLRPAVHHRLSSFRE